SLYKGTHSLQFIHTLIGSSFGSSHPYLSRIGNCSLLSTTSRMRKATSRSINSFSSFSNASSNCLRFGLSIHQFDHLLINSFILIKFIVNNSPERQADGTLWDV